MDEFGFHFSHFFASRDSIAARWVVRVSRLRFFAAIRCVQPFLHRFGYLNAPLIPLQYAYDKHSYAVGSL